MAEPQKVVPASSEVVDESITTPGAAPPAPEAAQPQEERPPAVTPVVIRLPSPSSARTLPKSASGESFTTISVAPQAHETLQELKLVVNDYVGGYWLGPYSLRIPAPKGQVNGDGPSAPLGKVKDGMEIRAGEKLSDWLEVADVFGHLSPGDERILEVVREPYSDVTARQAVQRLLELIMPFGTTTNHLTSSLGLQPGSSIFESVRDGSASSSTAEPSYQEIEVALPNGKKGKNGKKEVVKVKKELATDTTNPFADWKADSKPTDLASLPFTQPPIEAAPCLRSISLSPYNPPPPHLRQLGHQLYLQVALLEGDIHTLICTSRGWFASKSNSNTFDPAPRTSADGATSQLTHSLIDLLHTLSPQFSDRLSQLAPLSTKPPALEPFSTVAIPQHEPAYPWLVTPPKPSTTPELLRTQLAYLHTGAMTAEALDSVRDWNEELQGVRELPKESMQERVVREKMAQKTWAEFNAASIRSVINVARGDVPPLNPNDDARGHMWLVSNIFITRAIDCIDTYAHLGGDEAAFVSHAKDAAGVKMLNKLDVDGFHLLAHTVVDWQGDRWVCQSCLPGIFSRPKEEPAAETKSEEEKKDDTWVDVTASPSKSTATEEEEQEQPAESHLIIYGLDSEQVSKLHWEEATHKLMEKIGTAYRLAPHKVKDGNGVEKEFHASSEVKVLRGTDNRRYLLDLPRLLPVDVEFQEKDLIGGKLAGPDKTADAPNYPHRVVLLRPELLESFWENELKRWAREYAAKLSKKDETAAVENPGESSESKLDDASATEAVPEAAPAKEDDVSPAAAAAAAQREENDKPVDSTISGEHLKEFDLRFNPDAFVELAPARNAEDKAAFIASSITDESEPAIKAVRDASLFLRNMAIPAIVLDVLTGSVSGVMDGQSLSKLLHGRGVNMRYLGYIASTIASFSAAPEGQKKVESGHLSAFNVVLLQEMVFRVCKHILRRLIRGLQPEHIPCAVSHFLNCLLGTSYNASPEASYAPFDFAHTSEPAYVALTPESLHREILKEVQTRYRWALDESYLASGLRKPQLLRELATRCGFQLLQRPYAFDRTEAEVVSNPEDDKENRAPGKDGKKKKAATPPPRPRQTTFEPSDILTMLPIVKSTAPAVSVAEEIFEAGRNTINRGDMELGLEFMFEAIQTYENIHSVLHPEVAAAYNQYGSTVHQLARIKMSQITPETADLEQPLGLDVAGALRFQRQAVIIAERTLGVYHAETLGYYFQLAMLENLEGNAQQSLRYFRHVLKLWDVIHGTGHPEINTVLSNAGVVLQANNEVSLSLSILQQVQASTEEMFGATHLQTAQTLHQLTQAYFLAQDMPKALESSLAAYEIFKSRLGEENAQTKEVGKNVELLKHVADNIERQKAATQAQKDRQMERLRAAQARIAGFSRRRLPADAATGPNGEAVTTPAAPPAPPSRIGERGHLDVDELVNFIQGQSGAGGGAAKRAKNSLRGKRRTGAKR